MKNSTKLLALTFAAGSAGMAVFALANSAFVAALPGDVVMGVGTSLALLGFAAYDYSRRYLPLRPKARVLRPALTAATSTRNRSSECIAA